MILEKIIEYKEKGNKLFKCKLNKEALIEYNNAVELAMDYLFEIKNNSSKNSAKNSSVIGSAQIEPGRLELNINTVKNDVEYDEIKIELSKIYYNISVIHYKEREYVKCLESCESALQYHKIEQINNKLFLAYVKCGMYYKAIDMYKNLKFKSNEINSIIKNYKENEIAKYCNTLNYQKMNDFGEFVIDQDFFCNIIDKFCKKEIVPANLIFLVLKISYNLYFEAENIEFIDTEKKAYVFGDTHGQFFDTLQAIKSVSGDDFLSANKYQLNIDNVYVFNGDYVDRGANSVENITLLLLLKILYPRNIFLNRGNHEYKQINAEFGFYAELSKKYQLVSDTLFNCYQCVFACLPIATIINKSVFVVHGGLPENDISIEDIMLINRKTHLNSDKNFDSLMWSDPGEIVGTAPSKRRAGVMFGADITERFLKQNNLDLLVRSHEYVEGGVRFNHNKKCITIFSAPNYCGIIGSAAYLCFDSNGDEKVNENLCYSIGKIVPNYKHTY